MKIGVIGTGSMGKNHIRVLKNIPEVEGISICDANEESLEFAAKRFAIQKTFKNHIDLIKAESPDGIIIAAPSSAHKDLALSVMEHGIPILVEKPIAPDLKSAEEIVKYAAKRGLLLTVGHVERFNPVITKIKEFIEKKLINNIYLINTARLGPFPKRMLGKIENVLVDLAVHDFDIINYLGGKIKNIDSQIIRSEKQIIYAKTLMDLENGIKSSAEFSWISPCYVRKIEIYGDSGMIVGDYVNQEVIFYENSDFDYISNVTDSFLGSGLISAGDITHYRINKQEPLFLELTNFINAIRKKEDIFIKPDEALTALKDVLRIQVS